MAGTTDSDHRATQDAWRRDDFRRLPPDARQVLIFEAVREASRQGQLAHREPAARGALALGWVALAISLAVVAAVVARFLIPNVG